MHSLSMIITLATLCAAPLIAACSSSSAEEAYPDLQDCFDDHHNVESLPINESIVVCCTDHEIAGVKPACGATQLACETFVNAGLDDSITTSQITSACTEYITQLSM